jgi:hypothetical protein
MSACQQLTHSRIYFRYCDGYRRAGSTACRARADWEGELHPGGGAGERGEGHPLQCHQDWGEAATVGGCQTDGKGERYNLSSICLILLFASPPLSS